MAITSQQQTEQAPVEQEAQLPAVQQPQDNNPMSLSKPEFLRNAEPTGLELVRQYIVPPRLKMVQALSKAPLIDLYKPGTLVAVPAMIPVDEFNGPGFVFTPIFFWPEWIQTNPRELTHLPFIRDRSLDSASSIAVKSRTPATREEACPEDRSKKLNNIEMLNFMVVITSSSPIGSEPVLLSFSKGEHKAGTTFNSLIKMRKAPIFGCQFIGRIAKRVNTEGNWFGVDVTNPPADVSPWVADQATFNEFGRMHTELKEAYESKLLLPDYDEPAEATTNPEM